MALPSINPNRTPLETGSIVYAWADPHKRKQGDGFVELLDMRRNEEPHGYELWLVRFLKDGQVVVWWVHEIDLLRLPHPQSRLFHHTKGGAHEK